MWSQALQDWLYWIRDEAERKTLIAQGRELPIYTLRDLAVVTGMDVKHWEAFTHTNESLWQLLKKVNVNLDTVHGVLVGIAIGLAGAYLLLVVV